MTSVHNERLVRTVDTASVWNEAKLLDLIHEVLESPVDDIVELRDNEALDNPVAVPVI